MSKIKTKDVMKGTIKTLDKGAVATQKTKNNLVSIKNRSEKATSKEENVNSYADNQMRDTTKGAMESFSKIKKKGNNAVKDTKKNIVKTKQKVKNIKTKLAEKKKIKNTTTKGVKTAEKVAKKEAQKVAKETVKATKRAQQLAREAAKKTYQVTKVTVKATISAIKAILAATKALISAIIAGGWIAIIIIIVICLVGLLCSSIYGIFFSGEKTSDNSMSMQDAIVECNKEFSDKLESIQTSNVHDDYVLNGNMAEWKDILLIYAVKQSNGINEQEVITMNDTKLAVLKSIFWDMNSLTSEVKLETVTEQGVNNLEMPKEVQKQVLHITITSKTAEQMKNEYHFSPSQMLQYNELSSNEYSSLWNSIVYGIDSGEYTSWRQKNAPWSNIRIGSTTSTIGDIGCLVTSISILIQKSGVSPTNIVPFNPGTFVEELNKNDGFDTSGNLRYAAISKVAPNFKYVGNINLRNKTRKEKLDLITQYFNEGYYLTVEVKGATPGNQHWVAIIGINGNDIVMVDPATNHTSMWNAYEWNKTSQFNYFKSN